MTTELIRQHIGKPQTGAELAEKPPLMAEEVSFLRYLRQKTTEVLSETTVINGPRRSASNA